jgi:hypothetical protein
MNQLELKMSLTPENEKVYLDGLEFFNVCFIKLYIDGVELIFPDDTLVVFSELEFSKERDGDYLIFTSLSGIADEMGWERIHIKYIDENVRWNFEFDGKEYSYTFEKQQYIDTIGKMSRALDLLPNSIELEPTSVVFPQG